MERKILLYIEVPLKSGNVKGFADHIIVRKGQSIERAVKRLMTKVLRCIKNDSIIISLDYKTAKKNGSIKQKVRVCWN